MRSGSDLPYIRESLALVVFCAPFRGSVALLFVALRATRIGPVMALRADKDRRLPASKAIAVEIQ